MKNQKEQEEEILMQIADALEMGIPVLLVLEEYAEWGFGPSFLLIPPVWADLFASHPEMQTFNCMEALLN